MVLCGFTFCPTTGVLGTAAGEEKRRECLTVSLSDCPGVLGFREVPDTLREWENAV